MKNKIIIGHVALFVANILFGINNPISRSLVPHILDPFALSFFRLAGGSMLFWIASLFAAKEHVPNKDIITFFFASIFAMVLNQLPFIIGLSMTSSIDASIVVSLLPIATLILAAIILKEKITLMKVLGILIGASGALLLVMSSISPSKGSSDLMGNIVVLTGVISFALYITLYKSIIAKYSPITIMKWLFLFATIISLPICYSSVSSTNYASLSTDTYLRIFYVVGIATFLGYMLIAMGQKTINPTTLSMYNYIQPVVATIVAVLLGMDNFGLLKGISAFLVFSGVYIVTQGSSTAKFVFNRKVKQI